MAEMNTFSGKAFDPLNVTPEAITLADIAHALSLLCRGGGHTRYFYSVAQHSINCAREAEARGCPPRVQLACLLHDASEAYLADIIRPVKIHLSGYMSIEKAIMSAIWKKFGLDDLNDEENRLWKQIDDELLNYELKALLTGENHPPQILASLPDLTEKNWREVEKEFLHWGRILSVSRPLEPPQAARSSLQIAGSIFQGL